LGYNTTSFAVGCLNAIVTLPTDLADVVIYGAIQCIFSRDDDEDVTSEVINECDPHVAEDILARWVILDVGKCALERTSVDGEKTKVFRAEPYGDTGDCRCAIAALNQIHKASKVRVA
jgi:hypothetical protein